MTHVTYNTAYILQYKSHWMTSHIISHLAFCLFVALFTAPGGATRMPFRTKQTHILLGGALIPHFAHHLQQQGRFSCTCAMVLPQSPSSFSALGRIALVQFSLESFWKF